MSGAMQEWGALAEDWRHQEMPALDLESLRAEATRQGRRLRRVLVLETVFAAVVVGAMFWIALKPGADAFEFWLFGGLGAFLVPYQAYVLWLRRREWSEAGLDGGALLDLEQRRCRTTRRYWRTGMWAAVAIWLGLYGLFLHAMQVPWPEARVGGLMGGLVANVLLMPAMGAYGVWRSNGARDRCARLEQLQAQLRAS